MTVHDLADIVLRWDECEGHSARCLNDADPDCEMCGIEEDLESAARALRLSKRSTA